MNPAKTFPGTRRALDHLRDKFRLAGRGAMVRVARKLGLHANFFSELMRRERLDVGVLIATLRKLGISPAAFFAELEGDPGSGVHLWGPIRERPTPETRRAVRLAYRRMRAELAGVDLVAELESVAGDEEHPAPGGSTLGADWIEGLDGRRQDEPEAVAAKIAAGLDRVEAVSLPAALGVWCSALRLMLDLDVAAYLNRSAVRLAEAAGDSSTVADLYIRRGYIVADAGDHRQALTLAQLAAGVFASLGESEEMARALVSCSRWFHYLGRTREAIGVAERALDHLPKSPTRLSALQGLGFYYLKSDDLAEAERYAKLAGPLATSADHHAKILWLRASICRKRERLDESEALLRQVVEIFRGIHHGEAILSAVELVQLLLERGKPGEARRLCVSLFPLLEPLEENPIIGAAAGDLIRASTQGALSLSLVRQTRERIRAERGKDARARRKWNALACQGP